MVLGTPGMARRESQAPQGRQVGRPRGLKGRRIPAKVARDLDVPVVFANQCGATRTTIPLFGLRLVEEIADRFAGRSSICGGRNCPPVIAEAGPRLVLSDVILPDLRGPQ